MLKLTFSFFKKIDNIEDTAEQSLYKNKIHFAFSYVFIISNFIPLFPSQYSSESDHSCQSLYWTTGKGAWAQSHWMKG